MIRKKEIPIANAWSKRKPMNYGHNIKTNIQVNLYR